MIRKNLTLIAALLLCVLASAPLTFGQSDSPGSKDYPGITRMPGYYIDEFKDTQFDSATFKVTTNGKSTDQQIEGHVINITYRIKENTPATSQLQIVRNYQNATRSAGGQVLDDTQGGSVYRTTLRLAKPGKEIWILVEARFDVHWLTIVEREAMKQDVVVNADAMQGGLEQVGHVEVPGIFFDFNKSDVKPESKPALDEVAKLLKANPTLKVWVVGHTDSVGSAESNVTLSNARAAAVIKALTLQMGIDPKRLAPHGEGPFAPVASNRTEEGRAKNRRVELVER